MVYFVTQKNASVKHAPVGEGRQAAKRAATRARLLGAARDLFLTEGYEATTTRAILDRAGSSKGAMYHHFASKAEMLEHLFRDASLTAIRNAGAAAVEGRHLERLNRAALAWLGELKDPATRRILLELGPEGLGWRRAKEIEDGHSIRALTAILTEAVAAGEAPGVDPRLAARMINTLMTEAAFLLAEGGQAALPEIETRIAAFITSIAH